MKQRNQKLCSATLIGVNLIIGKPSSGETTKRWPQPFNRGGCLIVVLLLGLSKGNARVEIWASFFFSFSHSLQFFN